MDPSLETGGRSSKIENATDNMHERDRTRAIFPSLVVDSSPFTIDPTAQSPNVTSYPMFAYSEATSITILSVTFFIATTTVIGNLLVLLAFYLERPLRQKLSNYLVVSMAVTDLLLGAMGPAQAGVNLVLGYWPFGPLYCVVWDTCTVSLAMTTQTHAFAIGVDRYLSVRYPNKHHAWQTKFKMLVAIFFIWIFTNGTGISLYVFLTVEIKSSRPQCWLSIPNIYRTIVYSLTFFLRLIIMGYIYVYLYNVAHNLRKEMTERKSRIVMVGNMAIDSTGNAVDVMFVGEVDIVNQSSSNYLSEGASSNQGRLSRHANRNSALEKAQIRPRNCNQLSTCFNKKHDKIHLGDNKSSVEAYDESEDCLGWKRSHLHWERKHKMILMDISHKNKNSNSSPIASSTPSTITFQTHLHQPGVHESRVDLIPSQSVHELHPEQGARIISPAPLYGSTPSAEGVSLSSSNNIQKTDSPTNQGTVLPANTREKLDSSESDGEETSKYMKKALQVVVLLLVSNVVSYGPYATVTLLDNFIYLDWSSRWVSFSFLCIYINSMVNPLVYVVVNPLFKATLMRMSHCRCYRNQTGRASTT